MGADDGAHHRTPPGKGYHSPGHGSSNSNRSLHGDSPSKSSSSAARRPITDDDDSVDNDTYKVDPKFAEHLTTERDRRIQAEIKQYHVETVKLEREWRDQWTLDRKSIIASKETEDRQCNAHIKQMNSTITEIVLDKEEVLKQLTALRHENSSQEKEINELKQEISTYENGIAMHNQRIKEKQSLTTYKVNDDESIFQRQLKDLRRKIDANNNKRHLKLKENETIMNEIQAKHDAELESLEKGVSSD